VSAGEPSSPSRDGNDSDRFLLAYHYTPACYYLDFLCIMMYYRVDNASAQARSGI